MSNHLRYTSCSCHFLALPFQSRLLNFTLLHSISEQLVLQMSIKKIPLAIFLLHFGAVSDSIFSHLVTQLQVDKGADIDASSGLFGNALQEAAYIKESVVQLLFKNGTDINKSGGEHGNALQAASYYGSESVVQLLLDKGAAINASGGKYGSALGAASYWGH